MAFVLSEALADLMPAIDIFNEVEAAVATKPTTAAGWVKALGLGSVLLASAEAYDSLKGGGPVTLDEVVQVLGIPTDGIAYKLVALAKTVQAQAKD
jgi:hypothetical protein